MSLNPIYVEHREAPPVSLAKDQPNPLMVPLQIVTSTRDADGRITGRQVIDLTHLTAGDLADLHVQIEKRRGEVAWEAFDAERRQWAATRAAADTDRKHEESHLSEVRALVEAGMKATAEKEAAAAERERA